MDGYGIFHDVTIDNVDQLWRHDETDVYGNFHDVKIDDAREVYGMEVVWWSEWNAYNELDRRVLLLYGKSSGDDVTKFVFHYQNMFL